ARTLDILGVACTLVENVALAIETAACQSFDVILMDLHMPGMDGIEATLTLRRELGPRCPPILGLTADAFAETRSACLEAGMVGVISKPFRREDLAHALAQATHAAAAS